MPSKVYDLYSDKKISIIVPIYNEEEVVEKNLKLLEEELKTYFRNWEIIVVSDGSTDSTYEGALKRVSPHLKVFHYPDNQGKGFALKYGFSRCNGDFVGFIDGGMELHPKDIKVFLALMDIYDADAVIGSKRHPQSEVDYPWTRRVLSWIYQSLIRITLNLNVSDTQTGLKLFRRQLLGDSLPRVLVKKYAFDVELLTVANHLGYNKILEAPIKLECYGRKGKNLWSDLWRVRKMAWQMLWDTLAVIYRFRILHYYDRISFSNEAGQLQTADDSPNK
jgi:glycosyltransferase involved in cell wall biosynthesis